MTMTESDDAVRQLKNQLHDEVLMPLQTLLKLTGGFSSAVQSPNLTPLLELINERFTAILSD